MKKTLLGLAGILLVIQLSGCAGSLGLRPAELTPEMTTKSGIVFGSVTRVDGLHGYSSYYMDLREQESDGFVTLRVWTDGFSPAKVDVTENGLMRSIAANPVPPGTYEFFQLRAFSTNGYVSETVTFTLKRPIEMTIEAGKAYYIGASVPLPKIGENFMGIDEIDALQFILLDNAEADISLAREIYPNLPEVDASTGQMFPDLETEKILRIARAINPEKKYWEESAWERVSGLDSAEE